MAKNNKGNFLVLERVPGEKQTISQLHVCREDETIIKSFHALELPYRNNRRNISCIPTGVYNCKKRYSIKYKNHIHVLNVPNRDFILIHPGNTFKDTRGCILVGKDLGYVNNDSFIDLLKSMIAMYEIMSLLPRRFKILIENQD